MIEIFIPGNPKPQGSARAFVVPGKGGKPRAAITSANAKTNPWRADVHSAVRDVIGDRILYPTGAVWLYLTFVMPRPKSEPKATRQHTRKPDLDKLVRAAMDALTGIVYTDDSQVHGVHAYKRTAEAGEQPGLRVELVETCDAAISTAPRRSGGDAA